MLNIELVLEGDGTKLYAPERCRFLLFISNVKFIQWYTSACVLTAGSLEFSC